MNTCKRSIVALVLFATAFATMCGSASASPKIPLDYRAYDSWNSITGTALSDDGHYAAYTLVPQDGDPTLIVHDFLKGTDLKEMRGMSPAFTQDGKYIVFVVRALNADIHKARRDHKKPDEMPKNGIGMLDLGTGTTTIVDRVKDFKIAKDAGRDTLAYSLESPLPSPSPGSSSSATAGASPSSSALPAPSATPVPVASPSPAPLTSGLPKGLASPSASPASSPTPDDLHKKDDTATLVLRDLPSAAETRITGVSAYAVSHDGNFVAYAVQSKDGKLDGLDVRAMAGATTSEGMRAAGHYKDLTFAPKTNLLAFLSDSATFAHPAPSYALYQCDLTQGPSLAAARMLVDISTPAFTDAPPSENRPLRYTKDGERLYFGVAAVPTPVPTGTPDPVKVDIWNYQDLDLQSKQRHDADDERKRTYAAVVASDGSHPVRLTTPNIRITVENENPTFALGVDDLRYRKEQSWDTERDDLYAVSLVNGAHRLLSEKQTTDYAFSPGGGYVVTYDPLRRAWFSTDLRTSRRTDLTSHLKVAFYDELDDHPAPPPPYGLAGFVDGDKYVLLRDRYDVWAVDPSSGAAHILTGGVGRKQHIIFVPRLLDPDADSFDASKPILLEARNDDTEDGGVWRVSFTGPHAFVPQPIAMEAKAMTIVTKARAADRIVTVEQTFSDVANLWSTAAYDTAPARFSDANPQRAKYLWGSEKLVTYKSNWGVPLKGILLTPDGFDPHKKYPMLVYFYERFSDYFHHVPFTVPAPNTSPTLVRYVSNGYVVFLPDVAYRTGHPGDSAYGCIMPAIDSVEKMGFIDSKRIGIAGHSWAAYQIAYLLTRTNRFRAAEAGAAVANMTSAYGGIRLESGIVREFIYEKSQSRIGATPWDRTDLYIENSALFHIRNVNTPYLTIANELDGAVPQEQGIEFFTALRRLGKEAYLFSFDGEDHNLRGREQQKYWTVHLDEFFDHYLMGKQTPDWMSHGVDFLHRGQRNVDKDEYGESF